MLISDTPCDAGAEPLFYSLLENLEWDLAMGTSSLHCLRLDPTLRRSIGEMLVPTSKLKVCIVAPCFGHESLISFVGCLVRRISGARTSGNSCQAEETLDTPL